MLKFIGSGSAFNTKLGNNSAYYKEGNKLLLIDCGSNTFHRIRELNLLEGIEEIHVLITHTHPDHVGSLGDLIFYSYYSLGEMMKIKTTVYFPEGLEVDELIRINGASGQCYLYELSKESENILEAFHELWVAPFESSHVDEMKSFSYIMAINKNYIFYSGDINELDYADRKLINSMSCDYVYVDTCKADYEGNVHLSLRQLSEDIEPEARNKVWCMHLDEGFDRKEAEDLGFNVVINEEAF